jgi:hypothetical protein
MHMQHAHTHVCIHWHMFKHLYTAHVHRHTCAHTNANIQTHLHTCMHVRVCTHNHKCIHACTHVHTQSNTYVSLCIECTYTGTHTRMHALTTQTRHGNTCKCTCMYTHTWGGEDTIGGDGSTYCLNFDDAAQIYALCANSLNYIHWVYEIFLHQLWPQ